MLNKVLIIVSTFSVFLLSLLMPTNLYIYGLQDNITNAELGPKKKEFVEQFTSDMFYCRVNDIIEENGQELYYCHGDNTLTRNFDSKTWHYDTTAIYDAKNNALKVSLQIINYQWSIFLS
jgi:hypothetical protein